LVLLIDGESGKLLYVLIQNPKSDLFVIGLDLVGRLKLILNTTTRIIMILVGWVAGLILKMGYNYVGDI